MIQKLTFLFALFSACGLMAQPQPILRNAMTTNVAGTPVISQNNLSITNSAAGSTTNWLFYGTAPNTVARLVDIALGAGTLWATVVTQVDGTVTIGTNTSVTGTNIYGLSISAALVTTSNALQTSMSNTVNTLSSNRVVVTPGASITVVTSSPAANVIEYQVNADTVFGQAWFVWGSSNTLATNAAGVAYKAMQKSDQILPTTPNTNTYTTPTAGQYVGEVITAIPVGVTALIPGDINTFSWIYLSENRTMVLQPEIYIRTNMIAPSFSALGEREIGVGPQFTVNNVFTMYQVNIPLTTNVNLSVTNYLVRKYRVISVSGGTPNALFVSQGIYPARVEFPIGSSSFVLRSGDTMTGNLTLPTAIATTSLIVTGSVISGNSQTSTVVNAQWNTMDNANVASTISGGIDNDINGPGSDVAVIAGGQLNVIAAGADTSVISGGSGNNINANDTDCVISGGFLNLIDVGTYNSIGGGTENEILVGDFSSIGGGAFNVMTLPAASDGYSVIAGGEGNTINTHQSVISGGASNLLLHSANGFSTISGGAFNESSGDFTSLMGGALNTNSGDYSSIIGGYSNRTEGTYSVAGGRSAHSMQSGSWTLKDGTATPLINNTANSFKASFASGYTFGGGDATFEGNITAPTQSLTGLSVGTIDGTNITFAFRSGANSNQVLTLDSSTNVCATNILVDIGITWNTNAWTTDAAAANPTNWDVNMNPNVGGQRLLMSTNVNITNVVGAASGLVKSKTFLMEGAANRTLRVPEWWHTADGSRLYYVTNFGILSIQTFGIIHTNAVFKNFY